MFARQLILTVIVNAITLFRYPLCSQHDQNYFKRIECLQTEPHCFGYQPVIVHPGLHIAEYSNTPYGGFSCTQRCQTTTLCSIANYQLEISTCGCDDLLLAERLCSNYAISYTDSQPQLDLKVTICNQVITLEGWCRTQEESDEIASLCSLATAAPIINLINKR